MNRGEEPRSLHPGSPMGQVPYVENLLKRIHLFDRASLECFRITSDHTGAFESDLNSDSMTKS